MISESEMLVDLILLEQRDFDIILGMDWLVAHYASVDCYNKEVTFNLPDQPIITFKGTRKFPRLIYVIQAQKSMKRGGVGYLAYIIDDKKDKVKVQNFPIVRDFDDVFPDELQGLPPNWDIEFVIDLVPGSESILMPPYRMAPAELNELKVK